MSFDTHCETAASLIHAANQKKADTHASPVCRSCSWGNQSVVDTHDTFVPSLFLEPTSVETIPTDASLAPLVFSANQCVRRYPVMDRLRCSLSEKAIGGVRLPSNTAPKKG